MSIYLHLPKHEEIMQPIQNNTQRIINRVLVDKLLVGKVISKLKLTLKNEEYTTPSEGRIASNIIVDTYEHGKVMLRFYPRGCQDSKLESGFVEFEIAALDFLSKNGIKTPSPLYFDNEQPMLLENDVLIFAYKLLPGVCFGQKNLSVDLAQKSGSLLRNMLSISESFVPKKGEKIPDGDINHIRKIYSLILDKYPQLRGNQSFHEMFEHTFKPDMVKKLDQTPMGIVHADFFAENIVYDEKSKSYGIIDFGDAYFGHTVMDIVIGAMEFCVLEDNSWDMNMFKAFIHENYAWLKKNNVDFEFFHDLLLVNCLRFAIYTLPSTLEEKAPVLSNAYVSRFFDLKEEKLIKRIRLSYDSELSN